MCEMMEGEREQATVRDLFGYDNGIELFDDDDDDDDDDVSDQEGSFH